MEKDNDFNIDIVKKKWEIPMIFSLSVKKTESGDWSTFTEDKDGFNPTQSA